MVIMLSVPNMCGVISLERIERAHEHDTEHAPVEHSFATV
jgi:hypothetical protein